MPIDPKVHEELIKHRTVMQERWSRPPTARLDHEIRNTYLLLLCLFAVPGLISLMIWSVFYFPTQSFTDDPAYLDVHLRAMTHLGQIVAALLWLVLLALVAIGAILLRRLPRRDQTQR